MHQNTQGQKENSSWKGLSHSTPPILHHTFLDLVTPCRLHVLALFH